MTSTGTWETSQTITINTGATDLASSPYSFTSASSGYSTTNTRSGLGAGTYTGWIKDKAGNVGTVSYTVSSQLQYSYRTRGTSDAGRWTYRTVDRDMDHQLWNNLLPGLGDTGTLIVIELFTIYRYSCHDILTTYQNVMDVFIMDLELDIK